MIVHFIASTGKIVEEIDYYKSIVNFLKDKGHSIAYDWLDETYELAQKMDLDKTTMVNWRKVDEDNAGAISKADVVVVEATKKGFFVGYGVAQAVQQKKPVLILARDDSFPGATHLSEASPNVIYSAEYKDQESLEKVLTKFLDDNTIETKDMRFNFFIDRQIYNYLRWAAFKTGKTKAEVLRGLVQREIENKEDF